MLWEITLQMYVDSSAVVEVMRKMASIVIKGIDGTGRPYFNPTSYLYSNYVSSLAINTFDATL